MPSATPSDIYRLVADKSVIALIAIAQGIVAAGQNEPVAQTAQEDDRPSDAELAQWWLDFGITRKVTKRNCMITEAVVNQQQEPATPNEPVAQTGQEEYRCT